MCNSENKITVADGVNRRRRSPGVPCTWRWRWLSARPQLDRVSSCMPHWKSPVQPISWQPSVHIHVAGGFPSRDVHRASGELLHTAWPVNTQTNMFFSTGVYWRMQKTSVNGRFATVCARARCFKCNLQIKHMTVFGEATCLRSLHSMSMFIV